MISSNDHFVLHIFNGIEAFTDFSYDLYGPSHLKSIFPPARFLRLKSFTSTSDPRPKACECECMESFAFLSTLSINNVGLYHF